MYITSKQEEGLAHGRIQPGGPSGSTEKLVAELEGLIAESNRAIDIIKYSGNFPVAATQEKEV